MASESAIARQPQPDLLDILWGLATSNVTTVALLVVLAGTLFVAATVPQQPAGLANATAEYWLTATTSNYGSFGAGLRNLGVFRIIDSPWLRVLLALLAYHFLLRLAEQAYFVGRTLRRASPWPPVTLTPQPVFLPGQPARVLRLAEGVMLSAGYLRPTVLETAPERFLIYGMRRPCVVFGPALVYAGALLVLVALLINGVSGWTIGELALAPGSLAAPYQANGLELKLESLAGSDANPQAVVSLSAQDGRTARAQVSYGHPAVWGNLWLVQRASGPALAVTAQDGQARQVPLQAPSAGGQVGAATHVLFTATQSEQVFAVPTRNVAFRVVSYPALPERGISETVFLVEAYRGADPTPALSQLVRDQATLTMDGVTYTFRAERHAVLALGYLPGMVPLTLGALLTLAGILICVWWGSSETWVSLAAQDGGMQGLVRSGTLLQAELERTLTARALEISTRSDEP